ncbi:MAG: hypothetical protein ACUVSS_05595 [Anaerolineae bacterium]
MSGMIQDLPASSISSGLALRVLRLEQQLDSYQRLHAEELEELRRALAQVKEEVLAVAVTHGTQASDGEMAREQDHHLGR